MWAGREETQAEDDERSEPWSWGAYFPSPSAPPENTRCLLSHRQHTRVTVPRSGAGRHRAIRVPSSAFPRPEARQLDGAEEQPGTPILSQ